MVGQNSCKYSTKNPCLLKSEIKVAVRNSEVFAIGFRGYKSMRMDIYIYIDSI